MKENNCETTIINSIRTNDPVIFPIITRDNIFIKIPYTVKDRIDIKLISVFGNTLMEKSFISEELTISMEKYSIGMYILLLSMQNTIRTEKVIKTK